MKPPYVITIALILFVAGCISPEARREQERGYVRTSNKKFERADGGGSTKLVGVAREMTDRATALFPGVDAAAEAAEKEGKKVTAPRVISAVSPSYPLIAQIVPAEGEVWVAFVVGTDGTVEDARALIDSESPFSRAAVKAVMQWKFVPGRIAGNPARLLVTVPVRFELAK
jgi:TonB family protein